MNDLIIPLAGIVMPILLVPSIMAMRLRSRKREWEHLERMKALEMGVPVPGNEPWLARVCMAIGAGVPIVSFVLAWIANESGPNGEIAWASATLVGGMGIVCGTILASRLLTSRNRAQAALRTERNGKPLFDPDTYDVVGRRG